MKIMHGQTMARCLQTMLVRRDMQLSVCTGGLQCGSKCTIMLMPCISLGRPGASSDSRSALDWMDTEPDRSMEMDPDLGSAPSKSKANWGPKQCHVDHCNACAHQSMAIKVWASNDTALKHGGQRCSSPFE